MGNIPSRESKRLDRQFNRFNNRLLYSLITLGILAIFAVCIYASTYVNPATGVGHDFSELQPCPPGEILKSNAQGIWECGTDNSGTGGNVCPSGMSPVYFYINGGEDYSLPGTVYKGGKVLSNGWVEYNNYAHLNYIPPSIRGLDTCNNDNKQYTCSPDESKTCLDYWWDGYNPAGGHMYREVVCKRRANIGCIEK